VSLRKSINLKLAAVILGIILGLGIGNSDAGVSLKNGNFFIGYTDIVLPGEGLPLKIDRTYNSQSDYSGWFGFGWASSFESYLVVGADATITVHEHGGGDTTVFSSKKYSRKTVDKSVEKIIKAARKKGDLSKGQLVSMKKSLKTDFRLREEFASRYGVKTTLPKGTTLFSNKRGGEQKIQVKSDYFVRVFPDGKKEYYSKKGGTFGRLAKIRGVNGGLVTFIYDKTGLLQKIKDKSGRWIKFTWYPSGKVKTLQGTGTGKATYSYTSRGDLKKSKDVDGHKYTYEYDGVHNMKQIKYSDGTTLKISYQKKNNFVKKLKERNGTTIKYSYGRESGNPKGHFWTDVTATTKSGKSTKNHYEYWVKKKITGEPYTYKIRTVENNLKTETTYSECCGLPLKIVRNGKTTRFKYNKKGMLTQKVGPSNRSVKLVYHKKLNKPIKVTDANGTTNFTYDKKGNLTYAWNNRGQKVKLKYDRKGKISQMIDSYSAKSKSRKVAAKGKKSRVISFKYNEIGKPVKISLKGVGSIRVTYSNSGQIKNVKSSAGHKIALQVTSAFQNLLNIIAPAGVNLSI